MWKYPRIPEITSESRWASLAYRLRINPSLRLMTGILVNPFGGPWCISGFHGCFHVHQHLAGFFWRSEIVIAPKMWCGLRSLEGMRSRTWKKVVILNIRKFQQPVCPQIRITFSRSLEAMRRWASEKGDQSTILAPAPKNNKKSSKNTVPRRYAVQNGSQKWP